MKPPFFNLIVHTEETTIPILHGICAGFEAGEWRKEQLVRHLFTYLPEFALTYQEYSTIKGEDAVEKIQKAAANVYQTGKFEKRGEFGELLLHAIIKESCDTIPAISKIYYKDGPNDTVKGFDAVHVVATDNDLELWLGEVKFYDNINNAISDVIKELNAHIEIKYIKNEFIAIINKIDDSWPYANKLKSLLHPNTSLDDVFSKTCIPVLLTYDSTTLAKYNSRSNEYIAEIEKEFKKLHQIFCKKIGSFKLTIHLFLLPLNTKKDLIRSLEEKLKTWQNL